MATSTSPASAGQNGRTDGQGNQPATPPAAADDKPNGRRRVVLWGLLVVALIAGAIWLVHWWTVGRFIESTNDAYLRADSVTIAPKVSGYVTEVYVGDNQEVKAGQPLVKLDTRQYQASLDQSQATLDARKADIAHAEADVQQQLATIEQTKAQARVSSVNAAHAQAEYARFVPLAATGAETGERLADLRSTRDQAVATNAANLAAVKAAIAQVATLNAQIVQAKAQLEASEASTRSSQLDLNDTIVRSALDGRVGDRTVRVGQFAQPGTRMMTVVPVQDVYLVANFKETQVGDMRRGQPATLHVDALPGVDLHGTVDSFSPGTGSEFALLPPENATGNFTKIVQRVPVKIRIDTDAKTREVLVPGLSVTVDVDTKSAVKGTTGTTGTAATGGSTGTATAPASDSSHG